ncbi:MAG: Coenzyme F420 hydrogenase/dehydrogenase, beta subunit C-terminal domain [Planctomycetota bacterium]
MSALKRIEDVPARQMCCGCGACAFAAPAEIEMTDAYELGRRPVFKDGAVSPAASSAALAVCPGIELAHDERSVAPGSLPELLGAWGPVLAVWEGAAGDAGLRFAGSSGGAASALALYCMEREGMAGTLHIASRADVPYLNETVLSTTRAELLAATGSRYAPASPCDRLADVERASAPCVFIGKPCDVAATFKARATRPQLDANLGLTVAIFCAGTPSLQGTHKLLEYMGIKEPLSAVRSIRYRGNGWPGNASIVVETADGDKTYETTYRDSWHQLQKYRQWRCYVCVDHTGEFADVSVGDPWYREIAPGEAGSSLIIARTPRGKRIIEAAIAAGYLDAREAEVWKVAASQPGLLQTRGALWGRLWVCRLLGAATPVFRRLPMFRHWWRELTLREKFQSFAGTVKRVFSKRLRERIAYEPFVPVSPATRDSESSPPVGS